MDLSKLYPRLKQYQGLNNLYTPYSPSVIPGLNIDTYVDNPSTYGMVDRRIDPSGIFLNTNANMKNAPQVIPHEIEHVLQNRVRDRYKNSYDSVVIDELAKLKGSKSAATSSLITHLKNSASDPAIPTYFKNMYNYPIKYYGALSKGEFDLTEQWAELSAAEQYLQRDLTKDPYIKKQIFGNDDDLINTYKSTTGLRTDRWDAKDLAPMTVQPKPPVQPQVQQQGTGVLDKLYKMFQ